MEVINNTPFEFMPVPNYDREGFEVFTNIVKGTFELKTNQSLAIAEEQVPLTMADEFWGDPGVSPVKYESDLATFKPTTDLVLVGFAHNYRGKKIGKLDVTFGTKRNRKTVTVRSTEDRERIPLCNLDNFGQKEGSLKSKQLGNGFGFYPRQYEPRARFAGTYDDRWRANRFPFLPDDFDYRFFQSAYPELITRSYLGGRERIFAENVSPLGPIVIDLPDIRIDVETVFEQKAVKKDAMLDTVVLEPEERRLLLVWRQMIPSHNMIKDIRQFEVNMTSAS